MEILTKPKRRENESLLLFWMRTILYRIFILRFLLDYEKRQMSSMMYKVFLFFFIIQLLYYVNSDSVNTTFLNMPYLTIATVFYYANFERIIDSIQENTFILYTYTAFIGLYIVVWVVAFAVATRISKKSEIGKYLFYQYGKISFVIKIFTYFFHFHYFCASIIAVKFFFSYHVDTSNLLKFLLSSQGVFGYIFLVLLHLLLAIHLIEHLFELVLHIKSKKPTKNFSRTGQFEMTALILLRKSVVLVSLINPQTRFSGGYSITVMLALSLLLVTSFLKPVFYNFEIQSVFRKILVFIWTASCMNLVERCFGMKEVLIYFCAVYLFFYWYDDLLFELKTTRKLSRAFQEFNSEKFMPVRAKERSFNRFMSVFYYVFNNFEHFRNSKWIPWSIYEGHINKCTDVECLCQRIDQSTNRLLYQELICLFFEKHKTYFDVGKCTELAFIKLHIINELKENFFSSYLFIVHLWSNTNGISDQINLLSLIIDVDFILKKLDKKFTEQSGLDSQRLPLLYAKITGLKKEMVSTSEKYKSLWQEVIDQNPDSTKLSELVEDIILRLNVIEKRFNEIYRKSKNNYANLYNYSIFMVNVFNNDEGAKKLIDQLSFIKRNIDSVDEKLAIISQKFAENSSSMILFASGNLNQLTYITNMYFNYKEFLGYERNELVGHKITSIIPERIAVFHDNFVLRFFETSKGTFFNKNRIVTCMNKDGFVIPGEVLLRIMPNIQAGIQFVLYFTNEMYLLKSLFIKPQLFTQGHACYILFDDKKKVIGISEKIAKNSFLSSALVKNILHKNHLTNCYITDLFPELETDQEIQTKFFDGDLVIMNLHQQTDNEHSNKVKSYATGSSDNKSRLVKSGWDQSNQVFAKLAYSEWYEKGTIQISLMYFFESSLVRDTSSREEENFEGKKLGEIKSARSVKKPTPEEAKAEDYRQQVNIKAIKEIQTSFLKKYNPKTDALIKSLIIFLFIYTFGLFLYKFVDEKITTLEYFETYPTNSILTNRYFLMINKIFQETETISRLLSDQNLLANSSTFSTIQDHLNKIKFYYTSTLTQHFDLSIVFEYPLNPQIDTVALEDFYFNVSVINPDISSGNQTISMVSLNTMLSELMGLVYYIYNSEADELLAINKTAEMRASLLKLQNYFEFIKLNVFYNIDMKFEKMFAYRIDQINLIWNYIFTKGIVFFAVKLTFAVILIVAITILLVRYNKSTSIIMSIFTKFDQSRCLDNIQRCENFIEIMDYLDKHNINKIELSYQLQDNLFVAKEKAQLKNKTTIKSKNLEADKSSIWTEQFKEPKLTIRQKNCGFSKEIFKKIVLLVVSPIMILSNIVFFVSYSNPIRSTLINLEELRFNTGGNMINYVLQRGVIAGRFNNSQIDLIKNWELNVLGNAKSIPQIYMGNEQYAFQNSIGDLVTSINTDICKFWEENGKQLNECSLPQYKEILTKGVSTVFVYINNQLKVISNSQAARGESSLTQENVDQLEFLEALNLLILDAMSYLTLEYGVQLKSSGSRIIVSYMVFLAFQIVVMVVFLVVFMITYSRYFYFKKLFFEKIFLLVSLKTIGENIGLYNFLKRKIEKADEE